jgi:hypothetical protein
MNKVRDNLEVDHGSSSFAVPRQENKRIYYSPLANVALMHESCMSLEFKIYIAACISRTPAELHR